MTRGIMAARGCPVCPEDKICNPITLHCIGKATPLGRQLVQARQDSDAHLHRMLKRVDQHFANAASSLDAKASRERLRESLERIYSKKVQANQASQSHSKPRSRLPTSRPLAPEEQLAWTRLKNMHEPLKALERQGKVSNADKILFLGMRPTQLTSVLRHRV